MIKYKIQHQFNNLSLLKEVNKMNYCAPNQIVTSFPINAGGRTLLIGIDYNPELKNESSIHTTGCDGEFVVNEGWATTQKTKEALIQSALRQVEQVLNQLIPE